MPDMPPKIGDVLVASHVVTSVPVTVPVGWTLMATAYPRSPTMPDTLSREDEQIVRDHWYDYPDVVPKLLAMLDAERAHIDALTAAVDGTDRDMVGCAEKGGDFIDGAEWALGRIRSAILRGEQ